MFRYVLLDVLVLVFTICKTINVLKSWEILSEHATAVTSEVDISVITVTCVNGDRLSSSDMKYHLCDFIFYNIKYQANSIFKWPKLVAFKISTSHRPTSCSRKQHIPSWSFFILSAWVVEWWETHRHSHHQSQPCISQSYLKDSELAVTLLFLCFAPILIALNYREGFLCF